MDRGLLDMVDEELAHAGVVMSEARASAGGRVGAWKNKLQDFTGGLMESFRDRSAKLIRNVSGCVAECMRCCCGRSLTCSRDSNTHRQTSETYDVDLSYITPRVMAMAFPATGMEATYRNDIQQVCARMA